MRTVDFAEYRWEAKASATGVGPGPNGFSDSEESLFVDEEGLHLSIREEEGSWLCSEAVLDTPLGYGTYEFAVSTPLTPFEKQAVFGAFLYEDDAQEIDIEVSPVMVGRGKGQFVIQPGKRGNLAKFRLAEGFPHTFRIEWLPDSVRFEAPGAVWTYQGSSIRSPHKARFIFNLWLYKGRKARHPATVSVRDFRFTPAASRPPSG